ncbi:Selenoprotein P [Takifugu flavidus]|uniref:Selenoprotein P n=1 Tax=Takifugu flavidus TaxID=433684 RepID=A0A5C6N2L8_9TELE|nr:Selenoprotein P [Takifugu flavidus]
MVQASRMDSLRQRLENQGLRDVVYMVVSHQGAHAQGLHAMLAQRLTEHISLYKQDEALPDVWQTLGGNNNDFFIYDRCGRLTHRISLPYSIIGHGHVERAVKDTYCNSLCGECTHEHLEQKKPGMNAITMVASTMVMVTVIMGIASALTREVLAEVMVTTMATVDKVNMRVACTWVTYLRGQIT